MVAFVKGRNLPRVGVQFRLSSILMPRVLFQNLLRVIISHLLSVSVLRAQFDAVDLLFVHALSVDWLHALVGAFLL